MNLDLIRKDFSILKINMNEKKLVYLDNAATTQKPKQVINSIVQYYETINSNIHRGVFAISQEATNRYEQARKTIANFIGAKKDELVFTTGTTNSINLLSSVLKNRISKEDEILVTEMEHHSNFLPWQRLAKETGAKFVVTPVNKDGTLDMKSFENLISNKTKIVAITQMSNTLGVINPIKKLIKLVREKSTSLVVVDGAQSTPHMKIEVKELDCDFFAFSAHKMIGPTGIGALYGKKELLMSLPEYQLGGGMIKEVSNENFISDEAPYKFEAGTPNIAGVIGFEEAVKYLDNIGMNKIQLHEEELKELFYQKLSEIKEVELYGPKDNRSAVFSFNIKGIHSHDISTMLDQSGIAVREGHHCTKPLMKALGIKSSIRASIYFYNTKEEINFFIEELKKIIKLLS